MKEGSSLPNIFLFLLLGRIIQREVAGNARFNFQRLEDYINSLNGNNNFSTLKKYLYVRLDDCTLGITDKQLGKLFQLFRVKKYGSNWRTFKKLQEKELAFCSSELKEIYQIFENVKDVLVERFKDIPIDKIQYRNLFDENVPISTRNLIPNAQRLEKLIEERLDQVCTMEFVIKSIHLSREEIDFLKILNLFFDGIELRILPIISVFFNDRILPMGLVIHRLKEKGVIKVRRKLIVPIIDITEIVARETGSNFSILIRQLAVDNDTYNKNLDGWLQKVVFWEELGKWSEVRLILTIGKKKFKRIGRKRDYAHVLERYTNSNHFKLNPEPWRYWYLANCYNELGDLQNATRVLHKLGNFRRDSRFKSLDHNEELTSLYFKTFRLGIEILLNFNDLNLLRGQFNAVKLFIIEHFHKDDYHKIVSNDDRCQVLIALSKYFLRTGRKSLARYITLNLLSEFYVIDRGRVPEIQLLCCECFMENPEIKQQTEWALRARWLFHKSADKIGVAKSWLVASVCETDKLLQDKYLKRYFFAIYDYNFFDVNSIEYLKIHLKNNESGLKKKIRQQINNLVQIQHNNMDGLGMIHLQSLNFTSKDIELPDNIDNKLIFNFIKELSQPIFSKHVRLDSIHAQSIINSNKKIRLNFLSEAFKNAGTRTQLFYSHPLVIYIFGDEIKNAYSETSAFLLNRYFKTSDIQKLVDLRSNDLHLQYAGILARKAPEKSKKLLDRVGKIAHKGEYNNLLGNYYALTVNPNYNRSLHYYKRSIVLADLKYILRYKCNLGWLYLRFEKSEKYGEALDLFKEIINTVPKDINWPYPLRGAFIAMIRVNSGDIRFRRDSVGQKINEWFNNILVSNDKQVTLAKDILELERYFIKDILHKNFLRFYIKKYHTVN